MNAQVSQAELDEGSRIEALLEEIRGTTDGKTAARVDELVQRLVDLYGSGLSRIVERLDHEARIAIAKDDLVSALLVLHGLHPDDVLVRVEEALERARPYLASHAGGVALLAIDAQGVARIRLEGTCDGCTSSTATVRELLERAIREAAPEVVRVEVVQESAAREPRLVQIGRRDAARP